MKENYGQLALPFDEPSAPPAAAPALKPKPPFDSFADAKPKPSPRDLMQSSAHEVLSERDGNRLRRHELMVYLKLKTEHRERDLGHLLRMHDGTLAFVMSRKRAKHLLRKLNAYGINYELVKRLPHVSLFVIRDEFGELKISREKLLASSDIKMHSHSSDGNEYEKQYFVPLECFNR